MTVSLRKSGKYRLVLVVFVMAEKEVRNFMVSTRTTQGLIAKFTGLCFQVLAPADGFAVNGRLRSQDFGSNGCSRVSEKSCSLSSRVKLKLTKAMLLDYLPNRLSLGGTFWSDLVVDKENAQRSRAVRHPFRTHQRQCHRIHPTTDCKAYCGFSMCDERSATGVNTYRRASSAHRGEGWDSMTTML